jgi:SAM-dependent methyltransferase
VDLIERGSTGLRHPWETARFRFIAHLIRRHIRTEDPVILDIGCGDGFFLSGLSALYPRGKLFGVDIALSDNEVASLNKTHEGRIVFSNQPGDFENMAQRPADIVLLMDVIEHVENDVELLRQASRAPIASHTTRIFVTVPAFGALFTAHDRFLKHFRRYSLRSLRACARQSQCDVVEDGYFFSSLLLPRILQRLRERLLGPATHFGIGNWNRGSIATTIVERSLYLDARLAGFFRHVRVQLPGLSVFVVCRPL